jgi:hypothetical protein
MNAPHRGEGRAGGPCHSHDRVFGGMSLIVTNTRKGGRRFLVTRFARFCQDVWWLSCTPS